MWLDEFWTLAVGVPVVLAFVPVTADAVKDGFVVLHGVPDWYIYVVSSAVGFAFYRRAFRGVRTILTQPRPSPNAPAISATA